MSGRLCPSCLAVKSGDVVIHDPDCQTHGISPQQLREKVEALQEQFGRLESTLNHVTKSLCDRIEALEKALDEEIVILTPAGKIVIPPRRTLAPWKNDPALSGQKR